MATWQPKVKKVQPNGAKYYRPGQIQPPTTPGVYILALRGQIVYVGESYACEQRIWQHKDKDFDSYWFGAFEDRRYVELILIAKFRPKYNVTATPRIGEKAFQITPEELDGVLQIRRASVGCTTVCTTMHGDH